MREIALIVLISLFGKCLHGQEQKLTMTEYLGLIKEYHPIALQAGLNSDRAFLQRRQALGGFDPKIEVNGGQKTYDGKEYYNYVIPEVKVPLWYGIDLKANHTQYKGNYVNPENKVPEDGLSYFGVSVPLGRGLFLDERRAALRQAAVFGKQARAEQQQMLNNLFISAAQVYTEWMNAWLNRRVYADAVELAKVRLEGTRTLFRNGDKPAIDTIEATVLLQSREQRLAEYTLALTNKRNELASYLWLENLSPVDPQKLSVYPDTALIYERAPEDLLNRDLNQVLQSSLDVQLSRLKIDQLDIERRLKLEEVKPDLNLNIGVLNKGFNPVRNFDPDYFVNNQKLGFTVAFPLTFTKQRAAYSLSRLKIREAEYSLSDKQNAVTVKWSNYLNEYSVLNSLLASNAEIQKSNRQLLQGEEIKFRFGDSSIFMINSREQKVLETQEKLYDLYSKRIKVIQSLKWLVNDLEQNK
ncbi:TolC family protein [Desertivirga brevis]|uniref:TolC family protein n=1 Tax=Desertivirga brevis TaxID=2810310 RepID=UPI001A95AB0A|nr:TolC family protein [Pedobacter sp. SYSU D00873]